MDLKSLSRVQNRDVYSAAMIMFHALTGCCPFVSCLDHSQVSKQAQHNRKLFGSILRLPSAFPDRLKAFFRDCWDQKIGSAALVRFLLASACSLGARTFVVMTLARRNLLADGDVALPSPCATLSKCA